MNAIRKQKYNQLINLVRAKQVLIKRHKVVIKDTETQLTDLMIKDKIAVFQGDKGVITYQKNTTNVTIINLLKLFKSIGVGLFLQVISFNATLVKPLIKSGKIDSKIIDSVTSTDTKTTAAKLKISIVK